MEEKKSEKGILLSDIQADGQQKAQELDKLAFPLHVFPKSIRDFIEEANDIVGYPKDYLAAGVLFATSVAIGNSVQFKVKDQWKETGILYLALVGAPGINKTHPLNFMLLPIRKQNKKLFEEYQQNIMAYKQDLQVYKAAKGNTDIPQKPKLFQYLVSDITIEELISKHFINKRGIGLIRDELSGWINDMNKYRSGSDEQLWLSNFSRQAIQYDRKTGDENHIYINSPFISVAGTVQTDILNHFAGGNRQYNGFLERILFVFPQNLKKSITFKTGNIGEHLYNNYNQIIERLLAIPYQEGNEKIITFSKDALFAFKIWYARKSLMYNRLGDDDIRRRIISKMEVHVFRFAIILQMLHWADNPNEYDSDMVNVKIIQAAKSLADYFYHSAIAVYERINNEKADNNIKKIVAKFLRDSGFKYRQIADIVGVSHPTVMKWLKE